MNKPLRPFYSRKSRTMPSLSSLVVTTLALSVYLCNKCNADSSFNDKNRKLRVKSEFRQRMRNAFQRDHSLSSRSDYMTQDTNSPDFRRNLVGSLKGTPNRYSMERGLSNSNFIPHREELQKEKGRRLEDGANDDGDDDGDNDGDNNGDDNNEYGYGYDEQEGDEEDAYENNYNNYGGYDDAFDLSQFSMKYHSCTSLASYTGDDGGGNGEDGTVFSNSNYAVFRACPSDSCSDNSWSGCRYNYAEFIIPLYEYMEAQENNLKSEMEYYCGYCEECAFYEYYFGGDCLYHDDCDGYEDVCEDGEEEDLEQFFQCQAVPMSSIYSNSYNWEQYKWWKNNNDGDEEEENQDKNDYYEEYLYIGLHCAGKKIQFGLFADEECSNYIGNQIDVANATGLDIDNDDLRDYYTPKCSTCSPNEDEYTRFNYKYYGYQYEEGEAEEVCEYCQILYEESAKCLSNLYSYRNMELEDNVINSQEKTCTFIENVARGNVNEHGFVKGDFSYAKAIEMILAEGWEDITVGNAIGLVVTILGCVGMIFAIRVLKKQLNEPRGFLIKPDVLHDPVIVTRQDTYTVDSHVDPVLESRGID